MPLRFSNEVVIMVPFVRVIESDKPQVILGVDLLCTGHERWNFAGLELKANVGYLMFELGSRRVKVPLDNCPSLTVRMGPTTALPAASVAVATAERPATPKAVTWQVPTKADNPEMLSELLELLIMKKATEDSASAAGGQCL